MTMPFYTMTGPQTLGTVLKHEAEFQRSREAVTVLAGAGAARLIALGAVLGRRTVGAPAIAAAGGNTGNGALGALTLGAKAKVGAYTVRCVAAAANGGTFAVIDPDGFRLADAVVGAAYASPHLAFTISDGAADFVVGDSFTVTVAAGDGKVTAIDFAATDGRQVACGVAAGEVTAPDGADAAGLAIVREAVVAEPKLVWPDGASAGQKAAALAQLRQLGILARAVA